MALVVETGAVVSGANSYVTRATYIAYALARGVTIADADAADVQLVKAAEFIDSKEPRLKGVRTDKDNPMAWPRYDVMLDSYYYDSDEIPQKLKDCQCELALDINASVDLYNIEQSAGVGIKRERVEGAVEVEYAVADSMGMRRNSRGMMLLGQLMSNTGSIPLVMV